MLSAFGAEGVSSVSVTQLRGALHRVLSSREETILCALADSGGRPLGLQVVAQAVAAARAAAGAAQRGWEGAARAVSSVQARARL